MASGFKLLTPGNPKTEKGRGKGYWTFILHLAPAKLSGFNVCPMATEGCKAACLNTAGRGGIMAGHGILTASDVANGVQNVIQKARIRRTRAFFENREEFMNDLCFDIHKAIRVAKAKGFTPVFRLNGTSDIRWETVHISSTFRRTLFEEFPEVQFYDYTKIPNRRGIPSNYSLTFSLAENNEKQALEAFHKGMNIAVVFRNKETVARYVKTGFGLFGESFGLPVFVGDDTDLRFLDPKGHVIALYAKGNAKRDTSGFVRD